MSLAEVYERVGKGKTRHFTFLDLGGRGSKFFFNYSAQDGNLGQNEMEQQTSIPRKNQGSSKTKAKTCYFPILDLGEWGLKFPSILPRTVGIPRYKRRVPFLLKMTHDTE